jgi:hypothetical protein
MNDLLVSRRTAFVALASTALWPVLARAQAAARFRAIEVDVQPARQLGSDVLANWVAQDLPGLLRKSLNAYVTPGDIRAPILRARIDSVNLGEPHASGMGFPADSTVDSIEGAGVVIGAGGRPIASYPLLCSVRAEVFNVDPEGIHTRQRVATLSQSFAEWLPGKLGL